MSHPKRMTHRMLRLVLYTMLVWGVLVVLNSFVAQLYVTPSHSMEPTLRVGNVHLAQRVHRVSQVHRGDIVAFHQPDTWHGDALHRGGVNALAHSAGVTLHIIEPDHAYVKRVIGLPGDHVECRAVNASVLINGHMLPEPYVKRDLACVEPFDVTVPNDSFWVLGDNRENSADSAFWHASVPMSDLRGRFVMRVW